ncbi:MAG: hypothetical protein IPO22_24030 [Anaerolineales bacterium]|nr:hypothetical protein [Anaerolineales bacterium]
MNQQMNEQTPQNQPLTPAEEKQWAMISHFSVLLNLLPLSWGSECRSPSI